MNKTYLTIGALLILNLVLTSTGLISEPFFAYLHGWLLLTTIVTLTTKKEKE